MNLHCYSVREVVKSYYLLSSWVLPCPTHTFAQGCMTAIWAAPGSKDTVCLCGALYVCMKESAHLDTAGSAGGISAERQQHKQLQRWCPN